MLGWRRMHGVGARKAGCRFAVAAALVMVIAGCGLGFGDPESQYPESRQPGDAKPYYGDRPSVFGEGGLSLGDEPKTDQGGGGGIGVNGFLWRASLDTLSFMPLVSADPFGGVIITDWYSPPDAPGERFKVNLFILGRDLRADGIRAAVFRQERAQGGGWRESEVALETASDLENAILARARDMRIAQLGG